jgi:adenylate kinase family enzyme
MKVFIIGMPESGRTTVARAICQSTQFVYVDASSWMKNSFRPQRDGEHPEQYHDAYHHWVMNRVKENKNLIIDHVAGTMSGYEGADKLNWVIDGVSSPHDFPALFDHNKDFVVFLNRTDNQEIKIKDYETIGTSVIRDYCFWLSAGGILSRDRWHEYNFKMVGGVVEKFKAMGSKNSVFIVGSLDKVIEHLKEVIQDRLSQA